MAAVPNRVHSAAQQISARIGWNRIDAATQRPTRTRERVLNLSEPRTDHRNWGSRIPAFEAHFHLYIDCHCYMDGGLDQGQGRGTRFNNEEVANPTTPENLLSRTFVECIS